MLNKEILEEQSKGDVPGEESFLSVLTDFTLEATFDDGGFQCHKVPIGELLNSYKRLENDHRQDAYSETKLGQALDDLKTSVIDLHTEFSELPSVSLVTNDMNCKGNSDVVVGVHWMDINPKTGGHFISALDLQTGLLEQVEAAYGSYVSSRLWTLKTTQTDILEDEGSYELVQREDTSSSS